MFPTFSASVCGLQMDQKYTMTFRCNPADNKRYKFVNTSWVVAGKGESHIDDLLAHVHPDSPALGKHWLHNKVHFKKVKLTNNKNTRKGQVNAIIIIIIIPNAQTKHAGKIAPTLTGFSRQ